MRVVFQCKECEGGPCYVCAPNQITQGSMYDTGGAFSGSYPFPLLDKSPGVCYTEMERSSV